MSIEITFLGTGGAFTDFRMNYHNNAVVKTAKGPVLLDCGGTGVQSLKELGIPVWDLAGVVITHMHGDHIGGLEQLLWERYYTGPGGKPGFLKTPVLSTPEIHAALRRALHDCVDEYTASDGRTLSGGYDALVDPIVDESKNWGKHRFRLVRTPHVVGAGVDKPSYGVRVSESAVWCIYYTSDTTFRSEIGDVFPDARVIFHDCTFTPHYKATVHTHYEELKRLPPEVRGRIVLMHHTRVPNGVNVESDGFLHAASRHETFRVTFDTTLWSTTSR